MAEYVYGYFCGGDPRKFFPDSEECTAQEIENHKRACALWDEAESRGETPAQGTYPKGYGIGCYVYESEARP